MPVMMVVAMWAAARRNSQRRGARRSVRDGRAAVRKRMALARIEGPNVWKSP